MYTKSEADIFLEESIKEQEKSLREAFLANYKMQQQTLDVFKKSLEHCDFNNFIESRLIWNFASYINIVSYDLKIIAEHLFFSSEEWGKRYFARQTALLIYESLNDIFDLSGKEFRKIISRFSNSIFLNDELKRLGKELNEYKQTYSAQLKYIRNNCSAHRDQDSIEQLKIITSISWCNSIEYLTKFDAILMSYGAFMQKVINTGLDESKELRK